MKILVSGATGFIGKNLIHRLNQEKYNVYTLVRPSSNVSYLKKINVRPYFFDGNIEELVLFMQKNKFDGVIHLASLFLSQHKTEDIKELIDSNVFFGTALLEASVKANIKWFINTGTFWQHYQNKKYSPVNLYSATKQAFEDISQFYLESSTINFVTIVLSDTFGPSDTRPKIFNLWAKAAQDKKTLEMSAGEQKIDISFIDNVIDAYMLMINLLKRDKNRNLSGRTFAVRSNEVMSLKKLAQVFEQVTKIKLPINWGAKEYRPREVMTPWNKGEKVPGWKPKISLREGIKKTFYE